MLLIIPGAKQVIHFSYLDVKMYLEGRLITLSISRCGGSNVSYYLAFEPGTDVIFFG